MPKTVPRTTRTSQKYLRALAWFHENGPATAQQVRDAGVPFEYFDLNRILKAGLLVATGAVAKHLDADGKPTRGRPSPFYEITPQGVFVLTEATQPEAVTPGMRQGGEAVPGHSPEAAAAQGSAEAGEDGLLRGREPEQRGVMQPDLQKHIWRLEAALVDARAVVAMEAPQCRNAVGKFNLERLVERLDEVLAESDQSNG
jgi:hypothetical protein